MRNILVEKLNAIPVFEQQMEIVERKELGHPDTICDLIVNQISINLSREYVKNFGTILHHNIDKALLAAGEAENRFGGGVVKRPMLFVLGDRATFAVEGKEIPVEEIAINTAKEWFRKNIRFVDPDEHVKYQIELKHGSAPLSSIFKEKKKILGANDTSAAVGYAPLTPTEKTVLDVGRFLNSKKFKKDFPETGEDIKVMGLRVGKNLQLTIAMAFVDKFIDSEATYFEKKNEIKERIGEFLANNPNFEQIELYINTLDEKGKGIEGIYLTVTGTSADSADSGQVGRGNRVNGVISLNRPASNEAAAGKNPISHVGKIYNLLSFKIANELYNNISGLKEIYVWLLSQIGRPIDKPKVIAIQAIADDRSIDFLKKEAESIIENEFDNIDKFCLKLASGETPVC